MARSWKKKDHKTLLTNIKEICEDKTPTPDLFEELEDYGDWSDDYYRYNLLPDALQHLKEKGEIEIAEKRHEGGQPTHYWRTTE